MRRITFGLALALSLGATANAADKFTAADVLGWDRDSQDWYIHTSITMAGIVATQNPTTHAACIKDWYFSSEEAKHAANAFILDTMRRFPDHHPRTAVIAVIEKKCGSLNFTE